jgi:threonine/homoserine/homoserine lactone efflux protein
MMTDLIAAARDFIDGQPLLVLAMVHFVAVMSPGPTFLLISRSALASGRPAALAGTLACALGVLPWAIGAMLGLAVVFQQAQWLYIGIKVAGGLYLIYLAIVVWRHAPDPVNLGEAASPVSVTEAFRTALLAQLTNPKVAVFFASIFVTVLPPTPSPLLIGAILCIVVGNELICYSLVTILFSAERPRTAYLRLKPMIDRTMAVLLGGLGAKLLLDARPAA